MQIKNIKESRNMVMGIAMLMIIIFHTTNQLPHILDVLKNFGDFGVNLFLALSGFSMYFAWTKNPDTKVFYWNRYMRIGITYFPVAICWCLLSYLLHECSLTEAILKILTLQFWINGNLLHWFISCIFVLYLITPLWMKLDKKNSKLCMILTITMCIILCVLQYVYPVFYRVECFMHRVPAYFLGLYLGKMSWEGKECDKKCKVLVWVSFFISILLLVYMRFDPFNYTWKYIYYLLMTVPALFFISILCVYVKGKGHYKFLAFCGTLTLEMYLFQQKILKIGEGFWVNHCSKFDSSLLIYNILAIILSFIVGYFYHQICDTIYRKLHK